MAEQGRLKDAEEKFIEQTLPGIDYLAHYPGTIVSQSGQTFDFQPDSDRVPGLQGLTLNTGPGVEVTIDPLASPRATLFFANGDPGLPQLALGDTPGLVTYKVSAAAEITLDAPAVNLGADALEPLVLGLAYTTGEDTWFAAIITAFGAVLTAFGAVPGFPAPALTTLTTALSTTLPEALATFEAIPALSAVSKTS